MKTVIDIVHQDDDIIIVNKPPNIVTVPDRHQPQQLNVYQYLQEKFGRVFIVHRIDRETSGILCFAKTEDAHRHLCMQWEKREVEKQYLVLVQGRVGKPNDLLTHRLDESTTTPGKMRVVKRGGKIAVTAYEVVRHFDHYTLLHAIIKTGRQHQIRAQFAHIGHPLAIDPLYAKKDSLKLSEIKPKYKAPQEEEKALMSRLTLHAQKLCFKHPHTGERQTFEVPPPKDFQALLKQLEKWG
jgi:Pseudouridylate synthases, 23S RNA-specific